MRALILAVLLTLPLSESPPYPPGFKPAKILSPKASEQQRSLGKRMARSIPIRALALVPPQGFSITNITVSNGSVSLGWQNGVPPFQIQGQSSALTGPWSAVNQIPTMDRTMTFPASQNQFWRVQGSLVMPLTATGTNGITRLDWTNPLSMSDSLTPSKIWRGTVQPPSDPNDFSNMTDVTSTLRDGNGNLIGGTIPINATSANDPLAPNPTFYYKMDQVTANGVRVPHEIRKVSGNQPEQAQWAILTRGDWDGLPDSTVPFIAFAAVCDSAGNLFLAGTSHPFQSLGNQTAANLCIEKLSPTGVLIWKKIYFGNSGDSAVQAMCFSKDGNLLITGNFSGTLDFADGTTWTSSGYSDIFVAKLSATDGTHIWSTGFGSGGARDTDPTLFGAESGAAIATDATGNIFVSGLFNGNMTVVHSSFPGATGSQALAATSNSNDDFWLAKFLQDGSLSWAKAFGSSVPNEAAYGIIVDQSVSLGNVFITGGYGGSINFGNGVTLVSSSGSADVFIASFSNSGTALAAVALHGSIGIRNSGRRIVIDSAGNPIVLAQYNMPNGGSQSIDNNTPNDMKIVKLNKSTLATIWSFAYGTPYNDEIYGMTISPAGNIVVAGKTGGNFSFGTIPLSGGSVVTYLCGLKPDGVTAAFAKWYGGLSWGTALAIDVTGNMFLAGKFLNEPMDFGNGVTLQPVLQSLNSYLVKISP